MNVALIVAAGKGMRMNSKVRKQYLEISGRPILAHTLDVFDGCPLIDRIFLVVPEDDADYCRKMIASDPGLTKSVDLVSGGKQRQDSVYNGLAAIGELAAADPVDIVAIHDGVRPFVTVVQITDCITGARDAGACILGLPVHDTVKQVSGSGTIEATLERDAIWLAQTPQAFRYDLIMEAHIQAKHRGYIATDDASLVEQLGRKIKIIPGDRFNTKITRREDVDMANAIFQGRK
ncbi:MAG: 2-C-methyl-D-erythritol 4-phosphate cytidylyltransferase [Desulfobacterales bacterium]